MRKLFALLICSATLWAHPMGNFSVSHFAKLQPGSAGLQLEYVLDLAEIPTLEILQNWKLERSAPEAEIQARASKQAREWLNHLAITVNGRSVTPRLDSVKPTISDGAGNLPILRIEMLAHADASGGNLTYEDSNYSQRAGWKEIVVVAGKGGSLVQASQTDADLSHALMRYPADPLVAPPQDLRAAITWKSIPLAVEHRLAVPTAKVPAISRIPQPKSAPAAVNPVTMTAQGAPAGSVTRGDFLSRLLHQKELSLSMILIALAAAFGLGAVHALTPGHGKAIVAAYLVGSRGTLKHAAFLGAMVTFTHTISVFALGLATLFLFRFIVPERITAILGVLSGLSIVIIGAFMLYKRIAGKGHGHSHSHSHDHAHVHSHPHTHEHAHSNSHEHAHSHAAGDKHTHTHSHEHLPAVHAHTHTHGTEAHTHSHAPDGHSHSHGTEAHTHSHAPDGHSHSHGQEGHTHSHVPEELSWAGLVALGASGGLVPCESALVLLLGAIALGRAGLGLLLLVSFSLGLALVLMAIGVVVLYAKRLLPESTRTGGSAFFRWAGIVSPAVVMVVGLLMTAASLGWIESKWMVG